MFIGSPLGRGFYQTVIATSLLMPAIAGALIAYGGSMAVVAATVGGLLFEQSGYRAKFAASAMLLLIPAFLTFLTRARARE